MTHPDTLQIPRAVVEQAIAICESLQRYDGTLTGAQVVAAVDALRAALQPQAADQDPNSPWLSEAHMLCSDQGIPHGDITERIEALRDKLAAAEPVATIEISVRGNTTTIDNHFADIVRQWPEGKYKLYTTQPATQAENPLLKDYVEKAVTIDLLNDRVMRQQAALTAALKCLHKLDIIEDTPDAAMRDAAIAQIEALGVKHGSV